MADKNEIEPPYHERNTYINMMHAEEKYAMAINRLASEQRVCDELKAELATQHRYAGEWMRRNNKSLVVVKLSQAPDDKILNVLVIRRDPSYGTITCEVHPVLRS